MDDSPIDGRLMAETHRDGGAGDGGIDPADYAESPRTGGWTLRSALVRYAQPEPERASAVLELVRRTDGALKPFARLLQSPGAAARTAGLARVAADHPDELDRVVGEYESVEPLSDGERGAIPLLAVAVVLDELGDVLARWAVDRTEPRPDHRVDALARRAYAMLAALGVERERRPPRRAGR